MSVFHLSSKYLADLLHPYFLFLLKIKEQKLSKETVTIFSEVFL